MYGLLLVIIYLSFISLGLPDSLIGSAWPIMHLDLDVSTASVGLITIIISAGTVVSSLMSDWLIKKLGTGLLTAISVALTAGGLLGFSFSSEYWHLCVWAIPYGLGAGAVDASLNNYVALNYSAKHLNWLHCFWGIGAAISPYIMSFALTHNLGWNNGFRIVFYIQIALTVILFIAIPLWKKVLKINESAIKVEKSQDEEQNIEKVEKHTFFDTFKIKGVWFVLIAFLAYCALEQTAGIWATTFLVGYKGIDSTTAAKFASFFYIGITAGRAFAGLFADKIGDKRLLRIGSAVIFIGILLVALPMKDAAVALVGLIVVGVGCAPIYPAIIHQTPNNFGKSASQSVIGLQMAFAYIGTTAMPPIFGLIAQHVSVGLYSAYLLSFGILMVVMLELLNATVKRKYCLKTDEYIKL